jgi:hypothetical protein
MKWGHLPVAGGIYDQHPQLLEEWQVIFEEQNKHDKAEHDRREREAKRKK